MADDTARLIVSLEARIDQFQKALDKATGVADSRMAKIQKRFNGGSDQITRGLARIGTQSLATNKINEKLISGMSQSAKASEQLAEASGHISTQSQAAFHSIRAMAEGLALGLPPSQVLTQQLNHLSYAASGPGGLTGAFGGVLRIFSGLLTPFRLVAGGILGIGTAALSAAVSWKTSQSAIELGLTGVGKASGVTLGAINKIADSVSSAGDLSRSEAATVATAIAATGKVSADATEKATGLAHAYSLVFNKDLPESAKDLASALADPAKGIEGLNDRLGEWDASQVQLVKNLDASGDKAAAQQIILAGLTKAFSDVENKTTLWGNALNFVGNKLSNLFSSTGKAVAGGDNSPEAQLAAAQARLKQLQQGTTGPRGGLTFGTPQQIAETTAKIQRLTAAVEDNAKAAAEQNATIESSDLSGLVKGVDPTIAQLDKLESALNNLQRLAANPAAAAKSGLSSDEINKAVGIYRTQIDLIRELNALSKERFGIEDAGLGAEIQQNQIALQAINARTPAQKAEVAALQARQQAINNGESAEAAAAKATLARTQSLVQSQHDLSEAARDRAYQSQQDLQQGELENGLIGRSIEVSTRLTAQFQALAAAKAEAFKNGTTVSLSEQVRILADADEKARIATQAARAGVRQNAQFDIDQMGRSPSDQSVYATLQSARLLDNGKIVDAETQQLAAVLRTRNALQSLADTEKSFASSFVNDLIQGKSAAESLGDALNAVASKLVDLGIDNLISGLKPANSGLLSLFTAANGGVFVPGSGPQALKRYAGGGVSTKAAIFGEAGPEAAVPLPDGRRIPVDLRMPKVAAQPAAVSAPPINITINAPNSTKESVDALNDKTIPKIREIVRSEILQTANRSSAFKKAVGR